MRLAAMIAFCALASVATAADRSWTGIGGGSNWNVPANWSPVGVPANGDTLIFPAAVGYTVTNNLSSLELAGLHFLGQGWAIAGNAITLSGVVRVEGTWPFEILAPVSLSGIVEVRVASGGALSLSGTVQGSGGLLKTGDGGLGLSNANTYGGLTTVEAGVLVASNPGAFGATAAGTSVSAGGSIVFIARTAGLATDEPFNLAGSGWGDYGALTAWHGGDSDASVTCRGPITLADGTVRVRTVIPALTLEPVPAPSLTLVLSGAIGGSGGLVVDTHAPTHPALAQTIRFAGTAANTWTGGTDLRAGVFVLDKSAGQASLPNGAVRVGSAGTAVVRQQTAEQIGDVAALSLGAQGSLILGGGTETIGSLAGTGFVELNNRRLDLGSVGQVTFAGAISNDFGTNTAGSGAVRKIGAGVFAWTEDNGWPSTFSGFTVVDGVAHIDVTVAAPVTVVGGTLTGSGSVGALSAASGSINPGTIGSVGVLTCSGLALSGTATYAADIEPGANDVLLVNGTVSLGGWLAPVVLGSASGTYVIINNDDTDAVVGSFVNGLTTITNGGTGNDVVLQMPAVSVGFTTTALTVAEGGTAELTVTMVGAPVGTVTVAYDAVDGTASVFNDYPATAGTLTFAPGVTAQVISVPIIDDVAPESSESFMVRLVATAGGATISEPATATITIPNNDGGTPSSVGPPVGGSTGGGGGGCGAGSGVAALALMGFLAMQALSGRRCQD